MARLLLDSKGDWLRTAEQAAAEQGLTVVAGEPRRSGSSVIVPVRWAPATGDRLVPVLDADIELFSIGDGHCRLAVSGRYRVPPAQAEVPSDRMAIHRSAELALRRSLAAVAETLQAS